MVSHQLEKSQERHITVTRTTVKEEIFEGENYVLFPKNLSYRFYFRNIKLTQEGTITGPANQLQGEEKLAWKEISTV